MDYFDECPDTRNLSFQEGGELPYQPNKEGSELSTQPDQAPIPQEETEELIQMITQVVETQNAHMALELVNKMAAKMGKPTASSCVI